MYSLSQSEMGALREFINEHVCIGFIQPSKSPHGAPILFICKKDGSLRLCIDFWGLNWVIKKDRYALPIINDLLTTAGRACIYTTLDLWHAYHLVCIAEGEEWKTAFCTHYGSFEWPVMPFRLTNAPSTFQCFMNDIFSDLLDIHIIVYLDDILIFSDNPADHRKHVCKVLRWLHLHSLYVCPDKCFFSMDSVNYLGFILLWDGLKMDPSKVEAITDWPEPRKVKNIQSFLGFENFYRCFIPNYSAIVIPLTPLTHKDTKWDFSEKPRQAFETLKWAFTSAPVLTHWVPDQPIIVETDASDYALGAILSIQTDSDNIHPVAFHSHSFTPAEINYDTHDKDLCCLYHLAALSQRFCYPNWRCHRSQKSWIFLYIQGFDVSSSSLVWISFSVQSCCLFPPWLAWYQTRLTYTMLGCVPKRGK